MALSKSQILAAEDRKLETVPVPEWGGDVCILTMSGTERDAFEASIFDNGKLTKEQLRSKLLAKCLSDGNGSRLFTDEDVAALSAKSGKVLGRLFDIAQKMNGLTKEDVDDLTKNS